MELIDAINRRRSVRSYAPDPVGRDVLEQLLDAAVQAPTGMNMQPWAFGIIQGVEALQQCSAQAKAHLLSKMDEFQWLVAYQDMLSNPDYNLFYGAPALVILYAKPGSPVAETDCCLAAENLMLAAWDKGLGTCWIGFALSFLNQPEVKQELGVPAEYVAIAPIIVGCPAGPVPPVTKNPPEVLFWR